MKRISFLLSSIIFSGTAFILMNSCKVDNNQDYLKKVLANLIQIKSATYYERRESWAPGDTSASAIFNRYVKEYDNPSDSAIGANFVSLLQEDTTQMTFCYDGNMRAVVYPEDKTIVIDSFKTRKLPFRPLQAPFFNYTKNIIRYALETHDSVSLKFKDFKDSMYVGITIFEDRQVEFFGKATYMEKNPYNFGETTSKYELWISKSTDLPFRVRREMSHDISITTCLNANINKEQKIEDFVATDYFQPDYAVETFGQKNKSLQVSDLVLKVAPDWSLTDAHGNTFALKDFKSKVLMIQFTSVSCGPCRVSVPFLKQLSTEYNQKDFDFVAIESWTKNSNVLENYQNRNNFNYKFLMSTKEVTNSYQIKSVPVFFILDRHRVIRKVITGYGIGTTDKRIRDAINELI